ncbi:MAG: YcxB family protein [Lachnospiraceae bacterium]|nr:YcxB family protein [Lachnospiraceae bacterium]
MSYEYTYRNTPADFWKYYFGNVYRQWTGVINIVFIAASIILIVRRWADAGPLFRALMGFLVALFVVIQPLAIWGRSVKQTEQIGDVDTTLRFDEDGLTIRVKAHTQFIAWKDFRNVLSRRGYLLIMPDNAHAYILPDRVVGAQKAELKDFIRMQMQDVHE